MTNSELKSLSDASLLERASYPDISESDATRLTNEWVRRNVGKGLLPSPTSSGKDAPRILYNVPKKPR